MIFEKLVTDSIGSVGFLVEKIYFRPKKNFSKFRFKFLDPKFRKIFFWSKINFFSKKPTDPIESDTSFSKILKLLS